jgi:hypothetical protein
MGRRAADGMNLRWLGPLALLAALVIGDPAAIALRTAGLPAAEAIDPKQAFTRK